MEHSLEVFQEKELVFYSDGKWLHPLLELESFLLNNKYTEKNLLVKDKIVGRAAALLLVYLGIGKVKAGILSKPGKDALDKFGVNNEHEQLVDRVLCKTEELLKNENDPLKAYNLIKELAASSAKIKDGE